MAFDREYFTQMAYGGQQGNSIWHYYDVNEDNLASLAAMTTNTTYFSRAFDDHGIVARQGDIILISAFETMAENVGTPVIAIVPNTWDANGASIIVTGSSYLYAGA